MILKNSFIELRPFILEESNINLKHKYLGWLNDSGNIEFMASLSLYAPDRNLIDHMFKHFTSSRCQGYFIYDIKHDDFVGSIKLDKIDFFNRTAEIGIIIDTQYRGQNIAYEGINILLKHAFISLGLKHLWGTCAEVNIGMIKTFIKCGFSAEGKLRKHLYINGTNVDNLIFGILDKEYTSMSTVSFEL